MSRKDGASGVEASSQHQVTLGLQLLQALVCCLEIGMTGRPLRRKGPCGHIQYLRCRKITKSVLIKPSKQRDIAGALQLHLTKMLKHKTKTSLY